MTKPAEPTNPMVGSAPFPTSDAIKLLAEAGAALAEPTIVTAKNDDDELEAVTAIYTVPMGWVEKVVDLEAIRRPFLPGPRRKVGIYTVKDVASFLGYFDKHADPQAEVWVSPGQIVAVLDAHEEETPAWEQHRLILQLSHSAEWNRWYNISGRWLTQEKFAEFLEDSAADVVVPDMATIIEVARSLEATTKVDFESSYRTQDGQRGFKYKETTAAKAGQKGQLEIPEKLALKLRIYDGQDHLQVSARFRYRLTGDGLMLGIVIDNIAMVLEDALADVKAMITDHVAGDARLVLTGPAPINPR